MSVQRNLIKTPDHSPCFFLHRPNLILAKKDAIRRAFREEQSGANLNSVAPPVKSYECAKRFDQNA